MQTNRGRWVAIASVVAAMGLIAVGLWLVRGSGEQSTPAEPGVLKSYEFTIEMAAGSTIPDEPNGILKGWYEAPARTRWELGPINPKPGELSIFLVTEEGAWYYDPEAKTYTSKQDVTGEALGRPFPLFSNILVGSILPESRIDSITLQALPRDKILGREVAVLDSSAGRSASDTRSVSLWVDLEYRLVLRELTDTANGSYDARMVRLEINNDVDDSVFEFVPPPGAVEQTPQPTANPALFPTSPPSIFLQPGYVPAGFARTTVRTGGNYGSQPSSFEDSIYTSGGGEFTLQQKTHGGDELLPLGTDIKIAGVNASYVVRGDETTISWYRDGLQITLKSSTVSLDELLRIAESLRRQQ